MINEELIKKNLGNEIESTNFEKLGEKYEGKVRDNYTDKEKNLRFIVVTDRISAFDNVLGTIPFKGQVLNQLAAHWFEKTKDIAPSHFISNPDPNIMLVKLCKTFPIEVIVRGYITGSLWREYEKGEDSYGLDLKNMKKDQKFDSPIITPSTKADSGHDMPMTRQAAAELVSEEKYKQLEKMALDLFDYGTKEASERGLILVDTKYEFGETADGEIVLIDEIHTPDSSRYWIKESYENLFEQGKSQSMLDKEYVRQWLITEKNYMGDGEVPSIDDDVKVTASKKYIEVYEKLTGKEFEVEDSNIHERMKKNLISQGFEPF